MIFSARVTNQLTNSIGRVQTLKKIMTAILIAAVLIPGIFGLVEPRPTHAQDQKRSIESLNWLAGCWQGTGKQEGITEQWMYPAGGLMLGMGRTVKDGRAVEYEFTRISEEHGTLVYTATPSGQETASFTLSGGAAGEFIFENKQHDFPQRVIYKLQDGSLLARIEGTMNGTLKGIEFPMHRVPCPDGAAK
jgi:Domain of unknown function (DUF6265)